MNMDVDKDLDVEMEANGDVRTRFLNTSDIVEETLKYNSLHGIQRQAKQNNEDDDERIGWMPKPSNTQTSLYVSQFTVPFS